jgi:hypothetical protein
LRSYNYNCTKQYELHKNLVIRMQLKNQASVHEISFEF